MRRRLLNLLTLLSLLLCFTVCVVWVRSQFVADYAVIDGPVDTRVYARCWFEVDTGCVEAGVDRRYSSSPQEREAAAAGGAERGFWRAAGRYAVTEPYALRTWPRRARLNVGLPRVSHYDAARLNLPGGGGVREVRWTIDAPFWCLALTFALPPLAWEFRHRRANRRRRLGRCPA